MKERVKRIELGHWILKGGDALNEGNWGGAEKVFGNLGEWPPSLVHEIGGGWQNHLQGRTTWQKLS